jgi:hypothetical protein
LNSVIISITDHTRHFGATSTLPTLKMSTSILPTSKCRLPNCQHQNV